jgi:hypothetical protein
MKMSHRTARFVSAVFVSLLGCAPFVTASHGAPAEADKCLSGPKGAPPAGGHWYYRVDRATKRACWYVGDAKQDSKEKVARAAPETSPPAADSASPPNSVSTPPSIANARAEWPLPQSRVEQETSVFTAPRPLATVAGTIRPDAPRANADDAGAQGSVVASRWGELAGSSAPAASPGASTDNSMTANSGAAPTPSSDTAPATALPLAAAASSTEKPSGSVQMLLIAILGALALAGLLASVIFRLGGRRTSRNIRADRRVNWDSVRTDRPSLSNEARGTRSMREIRLPEGSLPRERRTADDERIAQMLSRMPRRSAG